MLRPLHGLWQHLDDPSRRTVLGFAFKLVLVLPIIIFGQSPAGAIHTIALLYGLWCGVLAIVLRERAGGPNLNYWDEALWFFAASDASVVWREHSQFALQATG